jgi:polar amino acid transport system substrate-binding protein
MNRFLKSIGVFLIILFSITAVSAETLTSKLKRGDKLRLGFGTAVPWAYAGDNGQALGFVNMIALREQIRVTRRRSIATRAV